MFSKRRQALEKRKRSQHSASALTEAERQLVKFSAATSEIELSFLDLLDVDRLLRLGRSSLLMSPKSTLAGDIGSKALVEAGSALSMASLGVGAITMFGTRVVGVKSVIEAITSLCELLGSRAARKWAGPIAGVMSESSLPLPFLDRT
jgi:mitofusin